MKKIIPIFYACDDNFVKYTIISAKSLIENASKDYFYKIMVLWRGGMDTRTKSSRRPSAVAACWADLCRSPAAFLAVPDGTMALAREGTPMVSDGRF